MSSRSRVPVAVVAASTFVALLAMAVALAAPAGASTVWEVGWTAAAVSALAGMLAARSAATAESRGRWTCWTCAAASWLAGQLAWDLVSQSAVTSLLADLGWWGFAVLVIAGVLQEPGSGAARLLTLVESVPLIAAATALSLSQLWSAAAASALSAPERAAALAYPVFYASAAVLTLQAMIGGSLRRAAGAGSRLVLTGMAVQALAFIGWSREVLEATDVPGTSPMAPLWLMGLVAIGAGGVLATRQTTPSLAPAEPGTRGGILPALMFFVLAASLIAASFSVPPLGARVALALGTLFSGATLVVRAQLLGRRQRELLESERAARVALGEREAQLARLNARLAEDSRRDPLTGLRNRRALEDDVPVLEARTRRTGEPLAVVLCDADRFKSYNDSLGHLAGDAALRRLAALVSEALRAGDVAYRYGGEELLLLLPGTDLDGATRAAERVRAAVRGAAVPHPAGLDGVLTVSVGVAAGAGDFGELLARADGALYAAKAGGRDRVVAAGDDVTPAARQPARRDGPDEPVLRHLRSLLAVTRAAADGEGAMSILRAAAEAVHRELHFRAVVANLRDPVTDELEAVLVLGDEDARKQLLGTRSPLSAWSRLLAAETLRCGAHWLPVGTPGWDDDAVPAWVPPRRAQTAPDAWDPDDSLLLPLRSASGEVLAVLSVDEPLSGRRPSDDELRVLMAVADHAALALERSLEERARADALGDRASGERLAAAILLAEALDMRDAGTAAHSRTVGRYAASTAARLGLDAAHVERVHAAGALHDLGKLGIADAILHKAGPLDESEWREMHRHPEIGARILEHAGLRDIAAWVLAHHERVDGRGYPHGVAGDEIPLEARILAVADAYEAMLADRPYRPGMPLASAREELRRCAGAQFDPEVVEAFLAAVAEPAAAQLVV